MAEQTRDIVIAPGEQAFTLDDTKGQVSVLVGPYKVSLSAQETLVTYEPTQRRFIKVTTDHPEARTAIAFAAEGDYLVLHNPAKSDENFHPPLGTTTTATPLAHGRKINIPGPATFPLWPGQHAVRVAGHHLRLNQYLLVRVYNDTEARANWRNAIVQSRETTPVAPTVNHESHGDAKASETESTAPQAAQVTAELTGDKLSMGQLLIVSGQQVSFYIPPTGVEVLADEQGNFVREAVTLETLEYCILRDEGGTKRFVNGPAVVFPTPTEEFITSKDDQSRKFRAIELSEISGIHVKVIEDYTEEDGTARYEGDELFITGNDTAIYYPRAEHAVIKYGDKTIHYAIAVPAGEGRYLLDRREDAGTINLVVGPKMLLPDPRHEVVVKRTLPENLVRLMYPGNNDALQINLSRAHPEATAGSALESLGISGPRGAVAKRGLADYSAEASVTSSWAAESASNSYGGSEVKRGGAYTPPRSITLDTSKYDGAVAMNIWPNHAILIASKSGDQRVVVGPQTALLAYDEAPMQLGLSTGKPKNTDNILQTVYLQVRNNSVSDIITAMTSDNVTVQMKLVYQINFTGDDQTKWFAVDNYVKFLCDNLRSRLSNKLKHVSVEEFFSNGIDIIRNTVLGLPGDNGRPGLLFAENGMHITDVQVTSNTIQDQSVAELLQNNQREILRTQMTIEGESRKLEVVQASTLASLESYKATHESNLERVKLESELSELRARTKLAQLASEALSLAQESENEMARKKAEQDESKIDLAIRQSGIDVDLAAESRRQSLKIELEEALTESLQKRAEAISTDLIAALQSFGDQATIAKAAEAMAPLAILKGTGVMEVLGQLLAGTKLADALPKV